MQRALFFFIPLRILPQPGAGGAEPGEKQDGGPEVIAVPLEEGALGAVDVGCRALMRGQSRVLVSVRLFNFCGTGQFPGERLTNRKQLPDERTDRRVGQSLWRDNQVVDTDRLDFVFRSGRRGAEGAAGNFLGLVERVLLGDRLRYIDREKFGFTLGSSSG